MTTTVLPVYFAPLFVLVALAACGGAVTAAFTYQRRRAARTPGGMIHAHTSPSVGASPTQPSAAAMGNAPVERSVAQALHVNPGPSCVASCVPWSVHDRPGSECNNDRSQRGHGMRRSLADGATRTDKALTEPETIYRNTARKTDPEVFTLESNYELPGGAVIKINRIAGQVRD